MDWSKAIFKPPLFSPEGYEGDGKRPVIFDILGPDRETSILPSEYRLVLWANPSELSFTYTRKVERIQTRGGWVEQHWGDDANTMSITAATGGFMRLHSGLSNVTNPDLGGTRRDTLAYDRYLDFLSLFHNNGSVYDVHGNVGLQGIIKVTFDGGVYLGWFTSFTVAESAEKPFQFDLTADFDIDTEVQVWRTEAGGRPSPQGTFDSSVEAEDLAIASPAGQERLKAQMLADNGIVPGSREAAAIDKLATEANWVYSTAPDGTVLYTQSPDGNENWRNKT